MSVLKKRAPAHKVKESTGDRIFAVVNYVILALFSLVCVLPILYVFMYSITPYTDYLAEPLRLIPRHPTFQAYKSLLNFDLMKTGYMSTLFITIVGTAINDIMLLITAYPLSKSYLKGHKVIMGMMTFTMFFSGGMIPGYLLIKGLGMVNTLWALIIPGCVSTYNVILMKNFILAIPASLEEAAYIDGANEIQILWKVVAPLCKPSIATFTLFNAVGHWNSYFSAIIYIRDRDKWPLMLIVRELVVDSGTQMVSQGNMAMEEMAQPFTMKMAVIIFTIVPILLVYPFVQKYFMKGMLLGGVKG